MNNEKSNSIHELTLFLLPVLVLGGIWFCWNSLFLSYTAHSNFRTDIFRFAYQHYLTPIYGTPISIDWGWFGILSIVSLASIAAYSFIKNNVLKNIAILCSFLLILILVNYSTNPNFFFENVAHFLTYSESVNSFQSPLDLLQNYTKKQVSLNIHSAHYPPGNLLLVYIFQTYLSIGLLKVMLYILLLASILMAVSLVESFSLVTVLTIPALFIYPALDVIALPIFFFTLSIYILLKVKSEFWKAILLGIVSSVWLFFNFSIFIFWLFIAIYFIAEILKRQKPLSILAFQGLHIAVIVFCFASCFLIFDFSIVENFKISVLQNAHLNSNYFDDSSRFLFRSVGNLLQFSLGMGLPFLLLFQKNKSNCTAFVNLEIAFFITLFIISVNGLFFMETDRVWLFFAPLVILLANQKLQNCSYLLKIIFTLSAVLYAVWFELAVIHFS